MSATPHDGTGTTLRLGSTFYTVTNIVLTFTNPNAADNATSIDVSHLGQTAGSSVLKLNPPLIGSVESGSADTGRQIQFDYLGRDVIADASTGTCTIVTGGTALLSGVAYTVASSTLTLALNDAIRGQATLTIARV
jgi:hypothetical protein